MATTLERQASRARTAASSAPTLLELTLHETEALVQLGIQLGPDNAAGDVFAQARSLLEGFGGATVGGSLVGYYNKLKTGVLDTIMLWPESVVGRKMYEVAPYMLKADLGTVNSKTVTANSKTWKKLPGEVRKAIRASVVLYPITPPKRRWIWPMPATRPLPKTAVISM